MEVKEHQRFAMPEKHSIIDENTRLKGNISCDNDMTILGMIEGDISCVGNLLVKGTVYGNIQCGAQVRLEGASIIGDIDCDDRIDVDHRTSITGSLRCTSLYNKGNIQGNCTVQQEIVLVNHSSLVGTIQASSFKLLHGGYARGKLFISDKR